MVKNKTIVLSLMIILFGALITTTPSAPIQAKKSHMKEDFIKGNCIPDNFNFTENNIDKLTDNDWVKPKCSEMNMTKDQIDIKHYREDGWTVYNDTNGKLLPYENQLALNKCGVDTTTTKIFMSNQKIIDQGYGKIYDPNKICIDAANAYLIPMGWKIDNIQNSGIYQTITLTHP